MVKLGLLVVGQSPRQEIETEFRRLVKDAVLVQRGCLDGLTRDEILALTPSAEETTLFTRLPNGEGVTLSKSAVIQYGSRQLDAMEASGLRTIVMLCTGEFPSWATRPVLFPSQVLRNFVFGIKPHGHLVILSPLQSQTEAARKRWSIHNHNLTCIDLSPNASAEDARFVGAALAENPPDLIVFDCISYTRDIKKNVCSMADCPGVLAITTIARTVAELLEQ